MFIWIINEFILEKSGYIFRFRWWNYILDNRIRNKKIILNIRKNGYRKYSNIKWSY